MEERIGKRINTERIEEALALNPDTISTACPYCLVMLGDAVAAKKSSGEAKDTLEVIDVAQLLARSVTRSVRQSLATCRSAMPRQGCDRGKRGNPSPAVTPESMGAARPGREQRSTGHAGDGDP